MSLVVKGFFHADTWTMSYVVHDEVSKQAAIIDPVMDFNYSSGCTADFFSNEQLNYIKDNQLSLKWILETHAHADHLSGAQFFKQQTDAQIVIGEGIKQVQTTFKSVFDLADLATDGTQFDYLVKDGDVLSLGEMKVEVLATPGHTNDSVTYVIEGNAFVGDTLFMPDSGTARCDFPGGDAGVLYDSIQRIYQLPDETVIWVCHDYQPDGRELGYKTTVAEQKAANIHIQLDIDKQQFVTIRETRDASLEVPKLILPSVQVNIAAGQLPQANEAGERHLKLPLNKIAGSSPNRR